MSESLDITAKSIINGHLQGGGYGDVTVSLENFKIKLIIWDLDDTLWQGTLAEDETPILYEKRAEIIKKLNFYGIVNSICSKNDFNKAKDLLIQMNLWDQFVFPKISYSPKGEMIKSILDEMHLQAKHTLFIDDNELNLNEVKFYNPEINVLNAKYCDKLPIDNWGKYDKELTRLKQYKTLEEKAETRKHSSSNEEFLRQSNIKVEFINYSDELFDRLYELTERTNQLNFTKNRMNKTELKELVDNYEIKTQLIRAEDNFGEYGIIGFYSLSGNDLIHFVFSCRIMNMGIEQFVYEYLNYPNLKIIGETASTVSKTENKIDYIKVIDNQIQIYTDESIEHVLTEDTKINIFALGACDLFHVMGYFSMPNQNLFYECNVFLGNERGVNVGTEYIRSQLDMNEQEKSFCKAHFLNYARNNVFKSRIFENIWDYVILSFHDDMIYKIYEFKDNPRLRILFSPEKKFGDTSVINIQGKKIVPYNVQREWLAENFKDGYYIPQQRFVDNVSIIASNLPEKTKIILLTGSEMDYFREKTPHCQEAREQIIKINQVIRLFGQQFPEKFAIVEMNEVVQSLDDITNYIFHLKAHTAYNLFLKIIDTVIKNFPSSKPPMLQKVLNGRKLCILGKGDLEMLNAFYNLKFGNCQPTEFIYPIPVNSSIFKITDWKQYANKSDEYFIVVADNANYPSIRQLLINGNYKPLKDFVQLKPIPHKIKWNDM